MNLHLSGQEIVNKQTSKYRICQEVNAMEENSVEGPENFSAEYMYVFAVLYTAVGESIGDR